MGELIYGRLGQIGAEDIYGLMTPTPPETEPDTETDPDLAADPEPEEGEPV